MANPKPIHPSLHDGLIYEARLRRLVLRPLFRNLRAGLSQASAAAQLLAELHGGAFQSTVSNDLIAGEVGAFMRGLSLKHKRMLIRSFQTALAIDITGVLGEAPIQTWMAARIKENVALIKTIGPAAHAGLAKRLTQQLQTTPFDEANLSKLLRQQYGASGYQLRRLSRDQTSKAIGNLTHIRHTQAGVSEYIWRTVRDGRVRPRHVELEGTKRRWGSGLEPGQDVQCRCAAEPILRARIVTRPKPPPPPPPPPVAPPVLPTLPKTPKPPPQPKPIQRHPDAKVEQKYDPDTPGSYQAADRTVETLTDAEAERIRVALVQYADDNAPQGLLRQRQKRLRDRRVEWVNAKTAGNEKLAFEIRDDIRGQEKQLLDFYAGFHSKQADAVRKALILHDGDLPEIPRGTTRFDTKSQPYKPEMQAKIAEALDIFRRLSHRDMDFRKVDFSIKYRARAYASNRGSYPGSKGTSNIILSHNDDIGTIIHELGHHFEYLDKATLQRAVNHMYSRTQGEQLSTLSNLTGKSFYGSNEKAREDLFLSPYYGKQYTAPPKDIAVNYGNTKIRIDATEIMSMGIEQLYRDPVGLAERDPDMFRFILRELRRRDRWRKPLPIGIPGYDGVKPTDPHPVTPAIKARAPRAGIGRRVNTKYGDGTIKKRAKDQAGKTWWVIKLDDDSEEWMYRSEFRVIAKK